MALAAEGEFTAYGPSHLLVLLVFAATAAGLVIAGRRYGRSARARLAGRIVAVAMLVVQVGMVVYSNTQSRFGVDHSLPLQLSDLVALSAVYALWSHRHWAFALTYYWGLVLSAQALFSPVLTGPDFPGRDFLVFWSLHLFVIWTAIYLTWGLGMRPGWRDYRTTIAVTVGWAAVAMIVNSLTGANYGFLNRKPEIDSILDVLGPWPWYLVPEIALVLGVWALMTWPWVRRSARRQPAV
ncbi:TIGR02206 family membrane protein [Actinophytocola sp.]|uniref:YwaF family protein n=1 Tax=Actinophytocola sp. TaxID=1872138 RepID=UPI003D6BCF9D